MTIISIDLILYVLNYSVLDDFKMLVKQKMILVVFVV